MKNRPGPSIGSLSRVPLRLAAWFGYPGGEEDYFYANALRYLNARARRHATGSLPRALRHQPHQLVDP